MILIQEESDLKLSSKLLSGDPNIVVRKFSWNIFKQKHHYRYLSCFDANNFLEIFLKKQFEKNQGITNFIANLYKDKKLENAFKKQTLKHIKRKFEVKRIFEKLLELNPKISLVNKNIFHDNYFDENFEKTSTAYFSTIFYKLKNLIYFLFYPLYVIFVLIFYRKCKSNCSVALRIYSNGLRMNDYD